MRGEGGGARDGSVNTAVTMGRDVCMVGGCVYMGLVCVCVCLCVSVCVCEGCVCRGMGCDGGLGWMSKS